MHGGLYRANMTKWKRGSAIQGLLDLGNDGKRDGGWDGSGRPKSQLSILPGLTHYTIFNSPALSEVAMRFLDGPAAKG